MFNFSEKLRSYIEKIETETGRQVVIQTSTDMGFSGMEAMFRDHPIHILVEVTPHIGNEQFEQSVAHEVTHGFIAYAQQYCRLSSPKRPLTTVEENTVSLLGTMIEDIVVNKVLQENGFQPFAISYFNTVEQETKAARKGRDYYKQFQDPIFKDRFIVFRYVMAWGYLHYYDLDKHARKILTRFEGEYKSAYPKQYKLANQIKGIILQNNIFTLGGYCNTLKRVLELWELDSLVEVSPD